MKNFFISAVMLSLFLTTYAQKWDTDSYDWEKSRTLYELDSTQLAEPAILLFNKFVLESEYIDSKQTKVGSVELSHRIYRVNVSTEISKYNKVYVPLREGEELVELKARTISPSGVVTELDKSKIKEIKDEDEVNYKIFAIEGAEEGGEIEYIYKVKKELFYYGSHILQFGLPVLYTEYTLIKPSNLIFEAKSYNGLPQAADTIVEEKRYLQIVAENIPAIPSEMFTFRSALRKRVEYKLAYNTARSSSSRLYAFSEAAQNIFNNIYTSTEKEKKMLSKALRKAKLSKSDSDHEKLIKIDTYVRKNFYVNSRLGSSDIKSTLDVKMTTRQGLMRLYAGLFTVADIESQILYTTDRTVKMFDPDFDSWNFLSEPLFYFPSTNKYLAPHDIITRYGITPYEFENNFALFVKKLEIGNIETGLGEVKHIKPMSASHNTHNLFVDVEFIDDMDKNKIFIRSEKSGQNAILNFAYYPFMSSEKQKELIEEVAEYFLKRAVFQSIELKTDITYPLPYEPIAVEGTAITSELIETAGDKILFRLGDVIGRQSELYAEKERKLPVENHFNRSYSREINVKIPENYRVANLDDINFNVVCVEDGEEIFYFKSSYELKDNLLHVNIIEAYERLSYPKEKFEKFRKVINAAADFNKVVLIFEPL